jgi:hypothetical protein
LKLLKPSSSTLPLDREVGTLLVGFILDVLGDRALANDSLDSLIEAALDLAALPGRNVGVKQNIDFLECLGTGLWVCEEDVEGHGETEGTENDVRSPLNVGESWGDCKVRVQLACFYVEDGTPQDRNDI